MQHDLESIYREYFNDILRYLLVLTHGNWDLAEELTQETFFKVIQKINTFDGRSSLYTWMCQIAKNTYYNTIRASKHKVDSIDFNLVPASDNIPETVNRNEEADQVKTAILNLREPYRTVLTLRILNERTFKEIAAHFQRSEGWVRVTYHRGKKKVKEDLE